jgi:hypothetical protein
MGGQVLGTNGFARIDGFASLLTGKLEDKPEPSTS